MKIADGVYLHMIKTKKFKTNHLKIRFTGKRDEKSLARRVLVAYILESVNAVYRTQQAFRERLAELYGATFSTQVHTKGLTHLVDVDMTFVKESFLLKDDTIIADVLSFLEAALFQPLVSVAQYKPKQFDLEKKNLINNLQADLEDPYYLSDLSLKELYFKDSVLRYDKYSHKDLVERENSYTVYQEFQKMLQQDRIDIFVLGEVDEYRMLQMLHRFPLEDRLTKFDFEVPHTYSSVMTERIEQKDSHQTILNLAYHLPVSYGSKDYFTLLVLNGLLGGFSHSRLFMTVREKEGLAYQIASQYDVGTQYFKIYAGIDRKNRNRVLQLINQQLMWLRLGRFSVSEMKQTKKMITNQAILSEDYPESLMELAYNRAIYGEKALSLSDWLEKLNQVTKKDMMELAQKIKLQALYIMEGQ